MKLYSLSEEKLKFIHTQEISIAVYGLGKMGLPLAIVFANQGFHVIGVDTNQNTVEKINKGQNPVIGEEGLDEMLKKVVKRRSLQATTDAVMASQNSDIKIILVPTYLDMRNNPDLSLVVDVVDKIAKGLKKGDIVILESTAPPGTTMNVIARMLEKKTGLKCNKDFGVAHCPERTSSGTALSDIMGRLDPKIIGGSDEKTAEIVKFIYEKINKKGVIPVTNTKVAELVKVWEGIYRDVNIAFANNLYLACREMGVDAREVIRACNTDVYSHILQPGPGVGGHCIPVYPYFILKNLKRKNSLLSLARKINDGMSYHTIQLIEEALQEKGKTLKDATVLLLGIAYRSGVKETRKSPGIKIANELKKYTQSVFVYDPLFSSGEVEKMKLSYKNDFKGIDCLVIATKEEAFKKINWKQVARSVSTRVVVDTQDLVDKDMLIKLGFSVRRIGYAH